MKKQQVTCQKSMLQKSAVVDHTWQNHHPIKWKDVTVFDRARTTTEFVLKEAIYIGLHCSRLNRDGGIEQYGCCAIRCENGAILITRGVDGAAFGPSVDLAVNNAFWMASAVRIPKKPLVRYWRMEIINPKKLQVKII